MVAMMGGHPKKPAPSRVRDSSWADVREINAAVSYQNALTNGVSYRVSEELHQSSSSPVTSPSASLDTLFPRLSPRTVPALFFNVHSSVW
jgi:hypothetical protein